MFFSCFSVVGILEILEILNCNDNKSGYRRLKCSCACKRGHICCNYYIIIRLE